MPIRHFTSMQVLGPNEGMNMQVHSQIQEYPYFGIELFSTPVQGWNRKVKTKQMQDWGRLHSIPRGNVG